MPNHQPPCICINSAVPPVDTDEYFVSLPKASPFTCALLCPQHLKLCLVCHGFAINTSKWMDESHSFLGWHRFKGYPVSNRLSFKSDVSVASIWLQSCVHASSLGSGWMWLPYTWIFFSCNRGSEGCCCGMRLEEETWQYLFFKRSVKHYFIQNLIAFVLFWIFP